MKDEEAFREIDRIANQSDLYKQCNVQTSKMQYCKDCENYHEHWKSHTWHCYCEEEGVEKRRKDWSATKKKIDKECDKLFKRVWNEILDES